MPSSFREDALKGQHIIISGGAGAIGIGVIKALTDHGANVTLNDVMPADAADSRLHEAGIESARQTDVRGELTQAAEVNHLIETARKKFGPIHTALCHAGIVVSGSLLDFAERDWDQIMTINVKAAFLFGQAAARAMIEDKVAGQLIFTSSWVAQVPWPDIGPYNTSKAAMNQLIRSFARELAPKNIRANSIAPGIVGVGMAKRQWDTEPDYHARASKAIPLGVMQPLESVADGFLFLCSPMASYMTGSVLLIDGGGSLYPMD